MIKPTVSTKIKDTGYKEFVVKMGKIKGSYVQVGVLDGEYENGVTVAQVALWNEFGTKNVPERSFLRSTLTEQGQNLDKWRETSMKQVIAGTMTPEQALSAIGFRLREAIKAKIRSNIPPPNAPAVAAAKIRAGVAPATLRMTERLLNSIEFKVNAK